MVTELVRTRILIADDDQDILDLVVFKLTVVIDLPLCELPRAPAADGNDSQSGGVSTNTPDLAH